MNPNLDITAQNRIVSEMARNMVPQWVNPPGRDAIAYRIGTYSSFLSDMLTHLRTQRVEVEDGSLEMPLARLNIETPEGFVIALLRSWASVGDVLTFYQERIANEGFLRTAVESRSVLELVHTLGYIPKPGVAASTYLAFTVADAQGVADTAEVAAGTAVQSIPTQGAMPQVFETSETLQARAAWNTLPLQPRVTIEHAEIHDDTVELRLLGARATVKAGDLLLIIGRRLGAIDAEPVYLVRVIVDVVADVAAGYTTVRWDPQDNGPATGDLQVYSFRARTGLFGANARAWDDLADAVKAKYSTLAGGVLHAPGVSGEFVPVNNGLPNKPVLSLLVERDGVLFVGTDGAGIYRSADSGATWKPSSKGLTKLDVYSLASNDRGELFAGTSGGGVFRSVDGGATWEMIRGGTVTWRGVLGRHSMGTKLPPSVVRALLPAVHEVSYLGSMVTSFTDYLFVGTDAGIYRTTEDGTTWKPLNSGLLGVSYVKGSSTAAVYGIALGRNWGDVFIGTSTGVYYSGNHGWSWHPISQGLPETNKRSGLSAANVTGIAYYTDPQQPRRSCLVAIVDGGLYRSLDDGTTWAVVEGGLPATGVNAVAVERDGDGRRLYAATDAGIYRSDDHAATWTAMQPDAGYTSVTHVATGLAGGSLASMPFKGFVDTEWPAFHLERNRIDLDTAARKVTPGSWVVLRENTTDRPARVGVYQVRTVGIVPRDSFEMRVTVTRLEVIDGDDLPEFDLRITSVYLQSDALELYEPSVPTLFPVLGHRMVLDRVVAGLHPGQMLLASGKASRVLVHDAGGVLHVHSTVKTAGANSEHAGQRDRVERVGLGTVDVRALTRGAENTLFAGSAAGAIYRCTGNERQWERLVVAFSIGEKFVAELEQFTMSQELRRAFEAGGFPLDSAAGVSRSQHGRRWYITSGNRRVAEIVYEGHALRAYPMLMPINVLLASSAGDSVIAGTDGGGIYRSADGGDHWAQANQGLGSLHVLALLAAADGTLLAGTRAGLYRSGDGGASWTALGGPLARLVVTAIANDRTGNAIWAATEADGMFVSTDAGATWARRNEGLTTHAIRALLCMPDGTILAGTHGDGVFRLRPGALLWLRSDVGLINRMVQVLALDSEGNVVAGTYGSGVYVSHDGGASWENLPTGVSSDIRALVTAYDGDLLAAARNVAIVRGEDGLQVLELSPEALFTMPLELANDLDQGSVSRNVARAFKAAGIALSKSATVDVAVRGSRWYVADAMRYSVRKGTDELHVFRAVHSLRAVAAPVHIDGTASQRWRLCNQHGFVGFLDAHPAEVEIDIANADDPDISEPAEIAAVEHDGVHTTVTLRANLANIYDGMSFLFYGNVVMATHGKTVENEVLGSGSGTSANQQFTLRRSPLTYVPANTETGTASTLTIRTKEARSAQSTTWHEVPTLYHRRASENCFVVRFDEQGRAVVRFGDGRNGARIPSGIENVVATYRTGIGPEGEVPARSLAILLKRPLGVRAVTNPMPATGAAAPDTMADARQKAPLTVRSLGRIISLRDYEDFARTFAGVSKARAAAMWDGHHHVAHITVAGAAVDGSAGEVLADGAPLLVELGAAVRQYRAPSALPVHIASYEPVYFNVEAQLWIEPDRVADEVVAAVRRLLVEQYNFDNRPFACGVPLAEITETVQGVEGVLAVRVDALYRRGFVRELNNQVDALGARWNSELDITLPAQLLMINAAEDNGIILTYA